jgi:hypothetical protein
MLIDRVGSAFSLRAEVYAEVEKDTSFTSTACVLVVVSAFLNQLGFFASRNLLSWLLSAIGGTVFAILGFFVGALVINWVGRIVYKADVRFDELVRTLGLAYVWQVMGVLGIATALFGAQSGEVYMVQVLAVVMLVISWFVAAREALDLGWLQTAVVVIPGWLVQIAIAAFSAGLLLGLFG